MKKIIAFFALLFIFSISFAQVQREKRQVVKTDSVHNNAVQKDGTGPTKKQMMKDLDLSREQKIKFKELRQSMQAKKQAIEADDKLSGPEKESRLKELRQEQAKNTMSILTPEQKAKMLKMRKEKKGMEMDEMDNE